MAFARSGIRLKQLLHTQLIESVSNSNNESSLVFLHGLLGNGRNVQTLGKKLCAQLGQRGLLVDLRGHGKSPRQDNNFPNTIAHLASDLHTTLQSSLSAVDNVSLVGHSLGGRVSLQYIYDHLSPINRVWLLDTVPGAAFASVKFTMEIANSFLQDDPVETRKEAETILKRNYYMDPATAQWLASSYRPDDHKFEFDLQVANDLLADFENQDFMHQLDTILQRGDTRIDMVRAERNKGWDEDVVKYFESLQNENFGFHVVADAGHWLHVDNLPGLLKVMEK
jgi:pimeloyl-ACP methyl ester carboxylesterase